jgi:hypothetical protein
MASAVLVRLLSAIWTILAATGSAAARMRMWAAWITWGALPPWTRHTVPPLMA